MEGNRKNRIRRELKTIREKQTITKIQSRINEATCSQVFLDCQKLQGKTVNRKLKIKGEAPRTFEIGEV